MRKALICILLACAMLLALCACSILNSAAEEEFYEFGADYIPSVSAVVGERSVSGVQSGTGTDGQYKEYTYGTDDALGDVQTYIDELQDEGWVVTVNEGYAGTGVVQLGVESADAGKILLLTIDYEDDSFVVNITKSEGTLDRY